MISFFVPTSKVQKDRRIMRETDSRMAKYGRRGLIFNFCAYLICLANGGFDEKFRDLAIVLTGGLLFFTLLRGFYLFRFDQLYPRAPGRWRNQCFFVTILGVIWWAIILCSLTFTMGLSSETSLLWLYTIVFFSTTANAFSPYQRFLILYQFIGLVPVALAAMYLGTLVSCLYGLVMLIFYVVLSNQCRQMSDDYWERLELTYALARKNISIEEEKRDTRALANLNKAFLNRLHVELGVLQEDAQAARFIRSIYQNTADFSSIVSKNIVLNDVVFNVRHEIQAILSAFVEEAEEKQMHIELMLSPTLPMRLKGDSQRLSQIVKTLMRVSLDSYSRGVILVDVEFLREYETAGELYVTISCLNDHEKKRFFSNDADRTSLKTDLSFVVARGIADVMDGGVEVIEAPAVGQQIRFHAKLFIAEQAGQLDFHRKAFTGHHILFIHSNGKVLDIKRQKFDALGLKVTVETQFKRAQHILLASFKTDEPIESVVYYADADDSELLEFSNALVSHDSLRNVYQVIASTRRQLAALKASGALLPPSNTIFLDKPVGLFELCYALSSIYQNEKFQRESQEISVGCYSPHAHFMAHISAQVPSEGSLLSWQDVTQMDFVEIKQNCQVILVDCEASDDFVTWLAKLRRHESSDGGDVFVPVIGAGTTTRDSQLNLYMEGLDDFIDLSDDRRKLAPVVTYWATLSE